VAVDQSEYEGQAKKEEAWGCQGPAMGVHAPMLFPTGEKCQEPGFLTCPSGIDIVEAGLNLAANFAVEKDEQTGEGKVLLRAGGLP
jgi:hypothetical protein